jgi:hypothetical protein
MSGACVKALLGLAETPASRVPAVEGNTHGARTVRAIGSGLNEVADQALRPVVCRYQMSASSCCELQRPLVDCVGWPGPA